MMLNEILLQKLADWQPSREGRQTLVAAVRKHELALVVDIVPNHVGVAEPQANPAWWDVLRHGPSSRFARWFDIIGWPLRLPARP